MISCERLEIFSRLYVPVVDSTQVTFFRFNFVFWVGGFEGTAEVCSEFATLTVSSEEIFCVSVKMS